MEKITRVLLIEDNPGDIRLVREMLEQTVGTDVQLVSAALLVDGLDLLRNGQFDIILLDLGLPDSVGLETLTAVIDAAHGLPVVVLTELADEAMGLKAVNGGAQDYLTKGETDGKLLIRSMRYSVERKKTQDALRKNEALLRSISESTTNLICVKDRDGRVIMANPAMLRFLGRSAEEVIGKDDLAYVANAEQARLTGENDRRVMETGRTETIEESGEGPAGRWTCLFTKSPHFDERGNVIGIVGIGVDITDRKKAQQRIQELLAFNETIIGTSPVGVITFKASGQCMSANEAAENITGGTVAQLMSQDFRQIESWKGSGLLEAAEEALAGAVIKREARFLDTFGTEVWCEAHFAPFYYENEKHLLLLVSDIRERKIAEEALKQSLEKESLILNSAVEGIFGLDMDGNCTFANLSCLRMLGYNDEKELLGKSMHDLIHNKREDGTPYPKEECPINKVLKDGRPFHRALEYLYRSDGKRIPVEYWTYPIVNEGKTSGAVSTFIDISERLALEEQLRHAQKMESVGVLAGGIAHDFNNILSAILGYAHVLLMRIDRTDPLRSTVDEIIESAERAATLTRSLLAFSRKQVLNVRPLDTNKLVSDMEHFLGRLVRENIEIRLLLAGTRPVVMADKGQIEQILLNLAVNARDAMPEGGCLTIQTENIEIDDKFRETHGFDEASKYVRLSVSDTGAGMERETQEKVFEPFFTTKEPGKGTGLGLSVVYGIVKQHNGFINVYSEPGIGTTFRIYLPLIDVSEDAGEKTVVLLSPRVGHETILVAEDDEKIRKLTRIVLEESGYEVILARDGEEALRLFSDNRERIELVILDMVMPKMNGRDVYRSMIQTSPDVRVIFSTGYTADRISPDESKGSKIDLMIKPVPPSELLRKVREVIDRKRET